jgi:hypothetical protein
MNGQHHYRPGSSSERRDKTVTDVLFISNNGLSQFTTSITKYHKMSPTTRTAYKSLPPSLRNVVDHTVAFRFHTKRRLGSANGSQSEYSKDAQFYVNLLEQANSGLVEKLPHLLALKCRYCAESTPSAESSHVSGCMSLLVVNDVDSRVNDLKMALVSRLKHILHDCPHAKSKMSPSELQAIFGQPFNENGPSFKSFAKNWIQDVSAAYFIDPDDSSDSTQTMGVSGRRDHSRSSDDIKENTVQIQQSLPPPLAQLQQPRLQQPFVTPPQIFQPSEMEVEQAQESNVRMVIDVQQLPPGVTNGGETSLSPTLEEKFRAMANPLQLLFTKTSFCKFYKRPAQSAEQEKYSQEAAKYLELLGRNRPQIESEALSSVCMYCTCCHGQYMLVDVMDVEASSFVFVPSVGQMLSHTMRCSASRRLLGDKMTSLTEFNFTNKWKGTVTEFAKSCLTNIQRAYFSRAAVLSSAQHPQPSLGFATIEATTKCQKELKPQEQLKQGTQVLEQRKQECKEKTKQVKKANVTVQKAAPRPTPNPPAPKPSPSKRQLPPSAKPRKKSPLKQAKLPVEYRCLYDIGLNDLEWTLVSPYESDDESEEVDCRHRSELLKTTRMTKLPSPNTNEDIWIPLQPDVIARCPTGVPYLVEPPEEEESAASKRRRIDPSNGDSLQHTAAVMFGRNFERRDVVIPAKGCTVAMAKVMNDMVGNQNFMRLVSDQRCQFANLTSIEEKTALAQEIVNRIRHKQNGTFYKASFENTDGTPIIKTCRKSGDDGGVNEILLYTLLRLDKGFPDVFDPTFLGSFESAASVPRNESRQQPSLEKDGLKEGVASRIQQLEHAPMVGILHGILGWSSWSIKDSPRMTLSDFINDKDEGGGSTVSGEPGSMMDKHHAIETEPSTVSTSLIADAGEQPFGLDTPNSHVKDGDIEKEGEEKKNEIEV